MRSCRARCLPVLGLVALICAAPLASQAVGQWEVEEISLGPVAPPGGNPFDVTLTAIFSKSGEPSVTVRGFYAGADTWKVRFSSGAVGSWTYATSSSHAPLDGVGGTVAVVVSDEPGPIAPDPARPTCWRHANGDTYYYSHGYSPFLPAADPSHPTLGGWQDYLDYLENNHMNGVTMALQSPGIVDTCSTCSKGLAKWSNLDGNAPPTWAFQNGTKVDYYVQPWPKQADPNTWATSAANVDFDRFYLPYWENIDAIVAALHARGMVAHLWPYKDETFWPDAESADETRFLDYIIARYAAYPYVMFNDAADIFELRNPPWIPWYFSYLATNDPFGRPRSSREGEDNFADATWRSGPYANDIEPQDLATWRGLLATQPAKPISEDDAVRQSKNAGISEDRFRQLAWWSVVSGPGGFGGTWAGRYEPGLYMSNLANNHLGIPYVGQRSEFLDSFAVDTCQLEVHDELLGGGSLTYLVADPGESYLVYFDQGSGPSVQLTVAGASEPLELTWFDPKSTATQTDTPLADGVHTLTKPAGWDDAVAYIAPAPVSSSVPATPLAPLAIALIAAARVALPPRS